MYYILLINDQIPSSGIGRYALQLTTALGKLCKTDLFSIKWSVTPDIPSGRYMLRISELFRLTLRYSLRLFELKMKTSPDIYHIVNPSLGLYARLLNPSVITVHDLIPYFYQFMNNPDLISRLENGLFLISFNSIIYADRIICVSESTKKDLFRFIDVDPKKVRIIYYGVDHELFKPRDKLEARRRLGLPLDSRIILNVGSEEPRKNTYVLLESFKELLNYIPSALLVRIGERTTRIERLIKVLDLSSKVLYRKAVSDQELALYYNATDLLCFPSYYEGFGNPPLEAMASGLPVIAGNRTSIPEIVSDAGILLDPFDVEGFAYWMREVLMNEDLRNRLSESGYKRSMNFSWEKCARETLEVYKEVLNEA